jgi:lipoprotein-releasing system ATP-binding protein
MNDSAPDPDEPARGGLRPLLRLDGVVRTFQQAGKPLEVLRGVDLSVARGEMVALVGPSGAGKSTLLQVAGLLERPNAGEIAIDGTPAGRLGDAERTELRRSAIGFVYQFHHLLPEFTATENVALPKIIAGVAPGRARREASELLGRVGLGHRLTHRPARLSGGEQQRVAIARALANGPKLLLADEPTGNLDHHTADEVFELLRALVHSNGVAALVATHNLELARGMDRTMELRDGFLAAA